MQTHTTNAYYLAWSADSEDAAERARSRFVERFGCEPAEVKATIGGIILAGPAPTHDQRPPTAGRRSGGQLALEV